MKESIVLLCLGIALWFNASLLQQQWTTTNQAAHSDGLVFDWGYHQPDIKTTDWTKDALVAATKMNVLYAGIDNPVSIAHEEIPTSKLELLASGCDAFVRPAKQMAWGGNYIVYPKRSGITTLTVRNKETNETLDFKFRVQPLPKPIVQLGKYNSDTIRSPEFKAQMGLRGRIPIADMDIRCPVSSYTMHYTNKDNDPILVKGKAKFDGAVKTLVQQAKKGDQYAFTDIYVRCSCDSISRPAADLLFVIK